MCNSKSMAYTVLPSIGCEINCLIGSMVHECRNHHLTLHLLTSYLTVCIPMCSEQYFHQPTRTGNQLRFCILLIITSFKPVINSVSALFATSCMFELPILLPWRVYIFLDVLSTWSLDSNASAHVPCHILCIFRPL